MDRPASCMKSASLADAQFLNRVPPGNWRSRVRALMCKSIVGAGGFPAAYGLWCVGKSAFCGEARAQTRGTRLGASASSSISRDRSRDGVQPARNETVGLRLIFDSEAGRRLLIPVVFPGLSGSRVPRQNPSRRYRRPATWQVRLWRRRCRLSPAGHPQ